MYLDELPDLARAAQIRGRARGVAIRDGDRAVAVAFVSDGSLLAPDALVRFDVTRGEDPARRLADALAATGARTLWFYGGDETARRAALGLELPLTAVGAVFARRMDSVPRRRVTFRGPAQSELRTLDELHREHAPAFRNPAIDVVEVDRDPVGIVLCEPLDARWTEVRVAVHPPYRGKGFGSTLLAAAADRLEAGGRRVCAAIESLTGRERGALEAAGFRLVDYYFTAARAPR